MKEIDLPIFKTKISGQDRVFKLEDPDERRKYFELKAGEEVQKLKAYLDAGNTFVGILLGPKNSGKGTYSKLFMEAVGKEHVAHISVGDIVRSAHKLLKDDGSKSDLIDFLKKRYRGFISVEKAVDVILGRDTKTLLPTEVILSLVEREIDTIGRKAVFIDGFPRNLDQISYSLFFRALMGYRDDPDFLVFIDIPEAVIDERMKYRVVCPKCQTPRNTKLLRTNDVGYDEKNKEFYLKCDNPECKSEHMMPKEGDELGIEAIRERIELDGSVIKTLLNLEGVPKVFLRNALPVDVADQYVDKYEITPAYRYKLNSDGKVGVIEEAWIFNDDHGRPSYSLLPAPVAVALIKQTTKALNL